MSEIIQNTLGKVRQLQPHGSRPFPMAINERIWPKELKDLLAGPNAVASAPGSFAHLCPNCGGHRIVSVFVWTRGPMEYPDGKVKWLDGDGIAPGWYSGELRVAPCPYCQAGAMREYIRRNCGLESGDLEISLETFKSTGSFAGKADALNAMRKLLGMNRQPAGFVTLLGDYGVGKSHLLKGVVNGFRHVEVVAKYSTLADLLADIRERFGGDQGVRRTEEIVDDLRKVRVLAVDEVDKVSLTSWAKETIFRLLDSRYNEQEKLLTILATNLAPEDFPVELGYLASRIRGGVVLNVPGPDMRETLGIKARRELNGRS